MRRKVVVQNNLLLDDVAVMVESGERVVLLTKGRSMLPFIVGSRDSVELAKIDDDICVGDIVLAKISLPTLRYVIHRVVKIDGDIVTLMGDGNLMYSEECTKNSVIARITAIIKPHKTIDPYTKHQMRCFKIWMFLFPVRRYLLAILRWTIY